ncbi:hypothetical protein CEXT_394731 [Caerostris extrusa]|uniref:Uncharacterized protein n=1 Tax=Caerostris extrusa TaxID=172846 RepID=A0AAV4Y8H1_CAEEX|nr:hypothetical protein CEXT_394731 [Caerostris extrusa]
MKTAKLPAPTSHSIDPTHTKDLTSPLFQKEGGTYLPSLTELSKRSLVKERERAANNHGIVSHCIRKSLLVDLMIALSVMSGKRPGTLYTGEVFSKICFVQRRFNDVGLESFEQQGVGAVKSPTFGDKSREDCCFRAAEKLLFFIGVPLVKKKGWTAPSKKSEVPVSSERDVIYQVLVDDEDCRKDILCSTRTIIAIEILYRFTIF